MSVVVYTKPDCPACEMTKKQLDKHNVKYQAIDVTEEPAAMELLTNLGVREMPYVDAGEHGTWTGFRYAKIKALA